MSYKPINLINGRKEQLERKAMKNKQMIQNKSPEIQLQCPVMVSVLAQLEPTRRLGSSPQ
jgi:hypothetical protein